jgi:sulfatase maturation enzyme AslB (radical SAM superfamily)
MQIKEVRQNWPEDVLRIDITLGNYCNYKCWYCFDGCNTGTHKFPEFELFTKNLSHVIDHYLTTTHKKKFDFHIMGGEVTHWPKFIEFIQYFKSKYDCIFTLTTNGSKGLDWWEKTYSYVDYVSISVHHEFTDPEHVKAVADFLYKKKVIVNTLVLMDPMEWDKCMSIINNLKTSKHSWAIRYLEIIQKNVTYTLEQKKVLDKLRARRANILWFLLNNKSFRSSVSLVDTDDKTHKVGEETIILERMNKFRDWECSVGENWIAVRMDGTLGGICGTNLYKNKQPFNLRDTDFVEKFRPTVSPTQCDKNECWCMFETNMPKKQMSPITKVIPIYAN